MSTEKAPKQAPQDFAVVVEPATMTVTGNDEPCAEVAESGIPTVCGTTEGKMLVLLAGFGGILSEEPCFRLDRVITERCLGDFQYLYNENDFSYPIL